MTGSLRKAAAIVLPVLTLGTVALLNQASTARADFPMALAPTPLAVIADSLRSVTSTLDGRINTLGSVQRVIDARFRLPVISSELAGFLRGRESEPVVTSAPLFDQSYSLVGRIEAQERYITTVSRTLAEQQEIADWLPTLTPTHGIYTSGFGVRVHPISGRTKMHQGIDLAAPTGTPILAAGAGVIVFSGWQRGYGNVIEIEHAFGYRTLYAHCSRLISKAGDTVARGTTIALVGNTGGSTGPHLHYEVSVDGQKVAPDHFLIDEILRTEPADTDVAQRVNLRNGRQG